MTPSDESLLAEYLAGKAASFELLVRRHAQELHQFVLRFTRSSQAAEDVVQEAFLQVHTSAGSFDTSKRFKPWLFTIAANKARDYLRAKNRKREVPIDATVDAGEDGSQRFVDLMQDDTEAPHEHLSFEERRRLVKNVVEDMPSRLSEVLILAYYHRFPYKEIAEIIDVPLGTVKSRLHAAVAEFKLRLDASVAGSEHREA